MDGPEKRVVEIWEMYKALKQRKKGGGEAIKDLGV